MRYFILVLILSIFAFSGCVQTRDYVGEKDGAFGLQKTKNFGRGQVAKKDYYVISGGDGIVVGDTKTEIQKKIGSPDKIDTTLEGFKTWFYADRGVTFIFDGERLNSFDEM